jgi:hypothetical protein
MNSSSRSIFFASTVVALILVGCGTPASSPMPTATTARPTQSSAPEITPVPSPVPTGTTVTVGSPAQAAALVFASDPRWAQMTPLRPDMVGQSSWYEASETGDGFTVNITVGQGDCMAGCIEHHTWSYRVDRAGVVELTGEDGDAVDVVPGAGGDGPAQVIFQLSAGPTCPVERDPPDPGCAPRPVVGAEIVVYTAVGSEAARGTSDDEGMVTLDIPAGAYYADASSSDQAMGTPESQAFAVVGGDQISLLFSYDTGIR